MNNRRLLMIGGGAVAVIALLSFFALAFSNKHTDPVAMRPVVVALQEIPARAPLQASMFGIVQKPADQVPRDAISSVAAVNGTVSAHGMAKEAVIESGDIAPASSLGLAIQLRRGMRAISIAVDPVKDVSGLLHPGDRVDVIAAPPKEGPNAGAYTIMRNVRVLSVGGAFTAATDPSATPAPDIRTVTLEVTPSQADLITLADLNATLRLALRPPDEPGTSGFTEHIVFFDMRPSLQPPAVTVPARTVVAPVASHAPFSVPVIDGDRLEGSR